MSVPANLQRRCKLHYAAPEIFTILSPREYEILGWLMTGESNKVIARQLGISAGTVKIHVRSIFHKLGVSSRIEAAVMAARYGVSKMGQLKNCA